MAVDFAAQQKAIADKEAAVSTQIGDVGKQVEQSAVAREGATTPLLNDVSRMQGEQSAFIERRQAGRPTIPDFKPQPPLDAKEFQGFSMALIGMAMIGGAVSRGNWLGVASSLNGAMKGYIEGNHALAEKNYKDYEHEFKSAMAKEQQWVRETEDVLKAKNLSVNQKLTQLRIVAAQYDKQDMLLQGRLKSLEGVHRAIGTERTALTRLQTQHEDAVARMNSQAEGRRQHEETIRALRGGGAAAISPETVTRLANRIKAGDNSVWQEIGRSQASLPLRNAIQEKLTSMGANAGDLMSSKAEFAALTSTLRQREQFVGASNQFMRNFQSQLDLIDKYVDKGVAGDINLFNKWIQAGRSAKGSPELRQFDTAIRGAAREHQRIVTGVTSNAQLHVSAQQTADELLNRAFTKEEVKAALATMREEATNAVKAGKDEVTSLKDQIKTLGNPDAAPPAAAPAPAAPAAPGKPIEIDGVQFTPKKTSSAEVSYDELPT